MISTAIAMTIVVPTNKMVPAGDLHHVRDGLGETDVVVQMPRAWRSFQCGSASAMGG